jgi:hypothetical protein
VPHASAMGMQARQAKASEAKECAGGQEEGGPILMGESDGLGHGLHARRLPASAVNSGGSAAVPQSYAACEVYFAGGDCASCVGSGPATLASRRLRLRLRPCPRLRSRAKYCSR